MYNYREAMKNDIKNAIDENAKFWDGWEDMDIDEKAEFLDDELWCDDSVTGNGSGSYACFTWEAADYVRDNEDLAKEAAREFCTDADTIAEHLFDYVYWDVTIRCYLLYEMVREVLEDLYGED